MNDVPFSGNHDRVLVKMERGECFMEEKLLQDDDLKDLFAQLNETQESVETESDPEMEASQRRYQEIIHKHRKGY